MNELSNSNNINKEDIYMYIENVINNSLDKKLLDKLNKIEHDIKEISEKLDDEISESFIENNEISLEASNEINLEVSNEINQNIKNNLSKKEWDIIKKANDMSGNLKFKDIKIFMEQNKVSSFNKQKFILYIDQGLIPEPQKPKINQSIYTKEHILWYILIDQFKVLGKNKLKNFIDMLKPALNIMDLYEVLSEYHEFGKFYDAVMKSLTPIIKHKIKNYNESEDIKYLGEYLFNLYMIYVNVWNVNNCEKITDNFIFPFTSNRQKRKELDKEVERLEREIKLQDEYECLCNKFIKKCIKDSPEYLKKFKKIMEDDNVNELEEKEVEEFLKNNSEYQKVSGIIDELESIEEQIDVLKKYI